MFCSVFFELTAAVVCQPSSVGFNMADVEVMKNLPEVCVPLLKVLLASPYRAGLVNSLQAKLTRQRWITLSHFSKITVCSTSLFMFCHCVVSTLVPILTYHWLIEPVRLLAVMSLVY